MTGQPYDGTMRETLIALREQQRAWELELAQAGSGAVVNVSEDQAQRRQEYGLCMIAADRMTAAADRLRRRAAQLAPVSRDYHQAVEELRADGSLASAPD